jgi:2-polyprenyl-3-methyl-5-hydroxy-6-metoxy-1,4-benzoquinol methylase
MSDKKNIFSDLQGDKYTSKNPIANKLLNNFFVKIADLLHLVDNKTVKTMTECGCGKGQVTQFIANNIALDKINAFDISAEDLEISTADNKKDYINFYQKSIYDIADDEKADLVVCCEVLEHLHEPDVALKKMSALNAQYYLFSVPNEPIWRILNFIRGKYMSDWGNTPDHRNHWSTKKFQKFVNQHLDVIETRKPLPWTMILAKPKHS